MTPPGRQFTGKNPPRPAIAFLGGRSYNAETFLRGRRYFNKGETYQFRDYLSPDGFFMRGTF